MSTPQVPQQAPVLEAGGNWVKSSKQFWKDFRERAFATFWQGAGPILVAAQPSTDWSEVKIVSWAAIVGGVGAVLSMGKSLLFRNRGIKNSASASKKV